MPGIPTVWLAGKATDEKLMTVWSPEHYQQNVRFVSDLGVPVLEELAPKPGERILDLGCGDGVLCLRLQEAGVHVTGVDSSAQMIEAARRRGVDAHLMHGEALSFDRCFDAVFSNAALHWMKPPEAVVRGVHQALRPRGRVVAEFGGFGNVQTVRSALHAALRSRGLNPEEWDPWYFPTVPAYAQLLRENGFTLSNIRLIPRPTPLPGDLLPWLEAFGQAFVEPFSEEERWPLLEEVRERVRPMLQRSSGEWVVDYVRLRVLAWKEGLHA
jgi:SAM-dependent methyltransferase